MGEDFQSGWQLTESDPGVFSELLKRLGTPLVVDDLYSLDAASLAEHQPIQAFIFLFQWVPTHRETISGEYDHEFPGFFAHQVVNNACATLAVMNAIGNIPDLPKAPELADLINFSTGMDPQSRGLVVTSSDWLREAHNALSPPSSISLEDPSLQKTSDEAYHFIVYMPFMGSVYEFDGLKEAPIRHAAYDEAGEGWVAKAREVIEARIQTYPAGSLNFSLLALHNDPIPDLQKQLAEVQTSGNAALAAEISAKLDRENHKRQQWAFENSLRRHNHIGLVHGLLKALAKAGKLNEAKENAKKALSERRAKKGDSMDED
ncbi:ubiquitin carboxyl-terminal hydrolase [Irpex lacteus]|nr:ubiquitin carboxyl-terminal hydrolase [Irpex lacteus]